jgi:hypothetical protein
MLYGKKIKRRIDLYGNGKENEEERRKEIGKINAKELKANR